MAQDVTLTRVQALLGARRFAEAAQQLAFAARAGNVDAIVELAQWCIAGNIIPRDLAEARRLLGQAGAAGHEDAALLHASFLASETGGEPDWAAALATLEALASRSRRARAQLKLLRLMDLDERGFPSHSLKARQLSERPSVALCDGFATPSECAHLAAVGSPYLQPSSVIDPASGRVIPHPIRTSDGAVFGVHIEDLVVSAINRRIATITATTYKQGEPLQLLRYNPGAQYRAHMDALSSEPNQRILTAILYLNTAYQGGETQFLRTGLSIRGKAGDLLIFGNVSADGRADPLTLHAGAPVTTGSKLIATRWIRKGPFLFPPPRPVLATRP
jgi:prolyl 4-hydroxylase